MTIGEGLAQAGSSIGGGFNNYQAGIAKAQALRQVVKAYAPEGEAGDAMRHLAATGSLGDLQGAVQSFAVQNEQQDRAQKLKLMQAQIDDYNAQKAQREQGVQDDLVAGRFLQNYLAAPAPVENTPDARLAYAAANTPGMSGRALPKIMDSLARWQNVTAKTQEEIDSTPSAMTMPDGGVVYYQKGTKNPLVVSPVSKANAYEEQQDKGPVYSPDGRMFWSKDHWAPLRDLGFPEGSTIKTVNGVNVVMGPNGQLLKTVGTPSAGQALIDALGANGTPAPATKPSAPAGSNSTTIGKYKVSY